MLEERENLSSKHERILSTLNEKVKNLTNSND